MAQRGDFEGEPEGGVGVGQCVGTGRRGAVEPVGAAEDEVAIEPAAAGDIGRVGVGDAPPRLGGFAGAVGVELDGGFAVAEAEAYAATVDGEILGGAHAAAVQPSFGAIAADRMGGGGQTEKCIGGRTTEADCGVRQHGEARDGEGAGGDGRVGGGELTELGAGAVCDDGRREGDAAPIVAAGRGGIPRDDFGGDGGAAGFERIGRGAEGGAAGVASSPLHGGADDARFVAAGGRRVQGRTELATVKARARKTAWRGRGAGMEKNGCGGKSVARPCLAGIFHTQLDQIDFTEDTEPRPQSGQGVWFRDLGSKLGALGEKEFIEESVIDPG